MSDKIRIVILGDNVMDKYVCDLCGYVYDPAVGDAEGCIVSGTSFENIPSDWVCPLCGVTKESFVKTE